MTHEQARQYLARVLPWPQQGDGPAWVNVVWSKQQGDKKIWMGRAVTTLDDAIKAIAWAQKDKATLDIYAGQASMKEAQERTTAKGWKYYSPVRLQENAVHLKSLWLDIDLKEGVDVKGYPTVGEAVAAIDKLVKETGLPKPNVIVSTGGGMHVYWVMDRALTPDEWYPLATALQAAGDKSGLKFDHVSADAARILRIPDTYNRKEAEARPVRLAKQCDGDYAVERLKVALEPYLTGASFKANGGGASLSFELPQQVTPKHALQGISDLAAGIETAMPQHEIKACLDAIPNTATDWNYWNTIGLRVYAASEGADYGLAAWESWSALNPQAGTKDSCRDRWNTFHGSPPTRTGAGALVNEVRTVSGDATWSVRAAAQASLLANTPGPAPGPNSAGAAQGGQGLVLKQIELPAGYTRNGAGIVCQVTYDDDGQAVTIPVSNYPLISGWLQRGPWTLYFDTVTALNEEARISIELKDVGGMHMRGILQGQGFMMGISDKLTKEFFMSWVEKLQKSKESVLASPFGWSHRDGVMEGFVFDGKLFTPSEIKTAANPDAVLANKYKPTGAQQAWEQACDLITLQNRPGLDLILASAFAAPLVTFAGDIEGLMICAWSDSGKGKTSTMRTAQAVWGHPKKAMEGLDDTVNSMFGKMGKLQSLPIFWDEIKTEEETKNFVKIAFGLSKGREKNRMKQNTDLREAGSWKTLLMSCSNDSILDYVMKNTSTTTAGLYRVFEYELKPGTQGQIELPNAQRIIGALEYNYGHAGLVYAQYLGENWPQIEKEYAALADALANEVSVVAEERYWLVTLTTLLLGAKYANQLGLTDINESALKEFLLAQLKTNREHLTNSHVDLKKDDNMANHLAQFLNAMSGRHTIKTNRIWISKGNPTPNTIIVLNNISRMDGCYVHMGQEDKLIRISSAALGEWLTEKGISQTLFVKNLMEMGARHTKGRLGSGTNIEGKFTEYLYELPLSGTRFAKLIDDVQ